MTECGCCKALLCIAFSILRKDGAKWKDNAQLGTLTYHMLDLIREEREHDNHFANGNTYG
jgi:hypothetical protein